MRNAYKVSAEISGEKTESVRRGFKQSGCGLYSAGTVLRPVAGSCKHGNETSSPANTGTFFLNSEATINFSRWTVP